MESPIERVAVLEKGLEALEDWRVNLEKDEGRFHRWGRLLTELNLWKRDREKKDESMEKRLVDVEKKLDAISMRFMVVWGAIIAVVSTALKLGFEHVIKAVSR